MTMHATGLAFDETLTQHETPLDHPEQPARYTTAMTALRDAGHLERCPALPSRDATDAELLACHTPAYLIKVREDAAAGRVRLRTGDTHICEASERIARRAAGVALRAVDAVLDGSVRNAFCVLRPPGHHAERAEGMGFCLYNNVAVAARYAQQAHGVGKVLIVDWDVHHGNGTQDIFYDDASVFFMSTHQHPWYPGTGMRYETGTGAGQGTTLNVPLPEGSARATILPAYTDALGKALADFKPELVLISAGFDAREGDPLGRFRLTDEDFVELTAVVRQIADTWAGGRLVSCLEGGYALDGLAAGVAAHVGALRDPGT